MAEPRKHRCSSWSIDEAARATHTTRPPANAAVPESTSLDPTANAKRAGCGPRRDVAFAIRKAD